MPDTTRNGKTGKATVTAGSGNVFADLELPRPDVALAKAKLVQQIRDLLAERTLTQAQAAKLLGLDQPKVSALVRGKVSGYTLERLFKLLNLLGQDVEILIRSVPNGPRKPETRVLTGS